MFINISNHPSSRWGEEQLEAARKYGTVVDINFPEVDPSASAEQVSEIAERLFEKIKTLRPTCVLVQGEMTLTYSVVKLLEAAGILAVAACSRRNVVESVNADGTTSKQVMFQFAGFRPYWN